MSSAMRVLPEPAARLLEVFGSSRMGIATKIALALVAEGMGNREAAEITRCGDYADLYRTAKRYSLTELHRERSRYGASSRRASEASVPTP
jgi:hypothetical protein